MRSIREPWIVLTSCAAAVLITAVVLLVILHRQGNPIPTRIRDKVGFTILEPQSGSDWRVLPKSVAYNTGSGILEMTVTSGLANITIDEQVEPGAFSDAPQVYPTLLNKLNQYQDLQTSIGTVTLTHPKELKGMQTGVVDVRQTLIFTKPSVNLTDSQWKNFFASMQWD